ncbi:core histone macro-H2A.1 [Trichonephila clavipes]|nr:core histone macro-H2A.1 [Trichonephila clavipes]
MSEWDYTNERVLFWMDLNVDFEWVCSTITSQNIYGRAPTIILLMMRPSRLLVKIRCHAVPSTRKRSAVRKNLSSTVARLRMGYFKGMKISSDNSRSYLICRKCPQTQLTPDYIFNCKAILASLFKLDASSQDILYNPQAPDLALLIIGLLD